LSVTVRCPRLLAAPRQLGRRCHHPSPGVVVIRRPSLSTVPSHPTWGRIPSTGVALSSPVALAGAASHQLGHRRLSPSLGLHPVNWGSAVVGRHLAAPSSPVALAGAASRQLGRRCRLSPSLGPHPVNWGSAIVGCHLASSSSFVAPAWGHTPSTGVALSSPVASIFLIVCRPCLGPHPVDWGASRVAWSGPSFVVIRPPRLGPHPVNWGGTVVTRRPSPVRRPRLGPHPHRPSPCIGLGNRAQLLGRGFCGHMSVSCTQCHTLSKQIMSCTKPC